ncbi:unnamed protein product [Protopolystoma xenopodis]|uniref:Uncharacterized protein n=1 Tax=Protopolystoma xenopodis TaxID=117903 RepID=A0A3S5BNA0_9PLAT|nr:unnamed protein product [Protopolystoma xenopodis]
MCTLILFQVVGQAQPMMASPSTFAILSPLHATSTCSNNQPQFTIRLPHFVSNSAAAASLTHHSATTTAASTISTTTATTTGSNGAQIALQPPLMASSRALVPCTLAVHPACALAPGNVGSLGTPTCSVYTTSDPAVSSAMKAAAATIHASVAGPQQQLSDPAHLQQQHTTDSSDSTAAMRQLSSSPISSIGPVGVPALSFSSINPGCSSAPASPGYVISSPGVHAAALLTANDVNALLQQRQQQNRQQHQMHQQHSLINNFPGNLNDSLRQASYVQAHTHVHAQNVPHAHSHAHIQTQMQTHFQTPFQLTAYPVGNSLASEAAGQASGLAPAVQSLTTLERNESTHQLAGHHLTPTLLQQQQQPHFTLATAGLMAQPAQSGATCIFLQGPG